MSFNPQPDPDVENAELEYKRSLLRSRDSAASVVATHSPAAREAGESSGAKGGEVSQDEAALQAQNTAASGGGDTAPGRARPKSSVSSNKRPAGAGTGSVPGAGGDQARNAHVSTGVLDTQPKVN